jgi:hypothetical protein
MAASSRRFPTALGVLGVALSLAGCAASSTLPPGITPKPMPKGGEWQGVYQGPYHIYLKITRAGDHAQGTWRAMGGREGELWGDLDGNVMKFSFAEHDASSKSAWSGRGYFVYDVKEPGDVGEIRGQWGLGMSETGGSWYAVKRPDVPLDAAEQSTADVETTGPREDNSSGAVCLGAGCTGEDRDLDE